MSDHVGEKPSEGSDSKAPTTIKGNILRVGLTKRKIVVAQPEKKYKAGNPIDEALEAKDVEIEDSGTGNYKIDLVSYGDDEHPVSLCLRNRFLLLQLPKTDGSSLNPSWTLCLCG